jgi:nucleoside-diphosphate-sugar epimerase
LVSGRIAVTGASGFIGRHVVAHLADRGDEVVAVRRPFEATALAAALRGVEAVVHLAGLVSAARERDYFAANVDGTRAVAEAARGVGARLVHVSSLAAAGPAPRTAPRSEDDPPNPITAYGRSKLESERVLSGMAGLRWVVLRPGVVYGPGDRAMLPLFRMATRGLLPLVGRTDAAYSMIHVADVVRTIAASVDSASCDRDVIFVGHPCPVTVRELLEGVRGAAGTRARIVRVPMPITRVAALAGDVAGAVRGRRMVINSRRYAELAAEGFVCRVDRLRDKLGVVAEIELREGLARTAEWYRREGWM